MASPLLPSFIDKLHEIATRIGKSPLWLKWALVETIYWTDERNGPERRFTGKNTIRKCEARVQSLIGVQRFRGSGVQRFRGSGFPYEIVEFSITPGNLRMQGRRIHLFLEGALSKGTSTYFSSVRIFGVYCSKTMVISSEYDQNPKYLNTFPGRFISR